MSIKLYSYDNNLNFCASALVYKNVIGNNATKFQSCAGWYRMDLFTQSLPVSYALFFIFVMCQKSQYEV